MHAMSIFNLEMPMRKYHKAPLPFLGQKRNWLRNIYEMDFDNKTVVDLFGGSGILSHEIKRNQPTATVVWNDFDDYQSRLDQLEKTESLRQNLLDFGMGLEKAARIDHETKNKILSIIKASGCTDYLTISSWVLFSGNYCHSLDEIAKKNWYFRVTKNPLSCDDYLKGVIRVQKDFRALLAKYQHKENVIFIADPPYIMTNQQGYIPDKNDDNFKLRDAIALIKALKGQNAILFSSTKSETDDLLEAFDIPITKRVAYQASSGEGRKYTELMYVM